MCPSMSPSTGLREGAVPFIREGAVPFNVPLNVPLNRIKGGGCPFYN